MIGLMIKRFLNGFCYSIAITMLVHAVIRLMTGASLLLPEFLAHFDGEVSAYTAELLLIGVMSAVTSAGTVVFETKRLGMVYQSILFILIMLSAWIPVACFVWGFHKYVGSMISTIASIVVTYGICWGLRYMHCRKEIDEINMKLIERRD